MAEEHERPPRAPAAAPLGAAGPPARARREAVRVELARCWDLLRQRRALRDAGDDPDAAQVRDADTVERYRQ